MNADKNHDRISAEIYSAAAVLEQNGRYADEKNAVQHGSTTVYEHSLGVAYVSCRIADRFHLHIDRHSLIRGALLHDYFLYDWHDKQKCPRLHGFCHPKIACHNAQADYRLSDVEKNIIKCHMFPLTLVPPTTKEGWLVCIADKICAFRETVKKVHRSKCR